MLKDILVLLYTMRFSNRELRFSSKYFNLDKYNKTRLISTPLTLLNSLPLYSKLD